MYVTHRTNPKKDRSWAKTRHLSHKVCLSAARFEKSQKGYISAIWAEAPIEAIYIKNCVVGDVLDLMTCAEFQNEIFRGYDFTMGRIFHFPIDF